MDSLSDTETYNEKGNSHQEQVGIPTKYLDSLKRGELASPNILLERVTGIKSQIAKHWWAISLILLFSIATCTRFYWQKSQYEKGFNDGYSKEEIEGKVKGKVDLIINKKMDSIFGVKFELHEKKNDSI